MNKVQTEHWINVSGSVSSQQNKQDQASVFLLVDETFSLRQLVQQQWLSVLQGLMG